MLSLDDPRWRTLRGGYRASYDPTPALRRLATNWQDEDAWNELWGELHHQGDLGDASYAAVPVLVELAGRVRDRGWNFYALVSTIETERHRRSNPSVPAWLAASYARAWRELLHLAIADLESTAEPLMLQSALGVVALAKGELRLGALISQLDASERDKALDDLFAWSELYTEDRGGSTDPGAGSSRPAV